MNLDYFQLIDRIVDLNLEAKTITVEASGSNDAHDLRGALPRFRSCPGSCDEAMA